MSTRLVLSVFQVGALSAMVGAARIRAGKEEYMPSAEAHATASPGKVDAAFTFGAPGWSAPAPNNYSSGICLPGLRVVARSTADQWWAPDFLDLVPWAVGLVGIEHFPMETALYDLKTKSFVKQGCTGVLGIANTQDPQLGIPQLGLHAIEGYDDDGIGHMPAEVSMMARFASLAYNKDDEIKPRLPTNWSLIGIARSEEAELFSLLNLEGYQVSHLFQDPSSLECVMSFEGTTDLIDHFHNLRYDGAHFCGLVGIDEKCETTTALDLAKPIFGDKITISSLPDIKLGAGGHACTSKSGGQFVHKGFRDQLRKTIQSPMWQKNIRKHLPYCSKLTVTGHSLGGAMAEMFAACMNKAPQHGEYGDWDYAAMRFDKLPAEVLPAL